MKSMKNVSKKFFALFAVLCMALTMLPVQVFAAGKMYIDTPAAAIAPEHSIIIGLHNPKKNVKWTASDDSVASIKCLKTTYDKYTRTYVAKVKVTAKKAGIIDIKAKCGKKKYNCRLTVIDTLKTRINYSSKTVKKGESLFLQLYNPVNPSTTASASKKGIVGIKSCGYANGSKFVRVTAKKAGKTTIKIKDKGTGQVYKCKVTVLK